MRIALILPLRRLGRWHERLAKALAGQHAVSLFFDETAPAYPAPLRATLAAERLIYREPPPPFSATFAERYRARSDELDPEKFDRIVDLSERAQPRGDAIAVFYDGSPDSLALVARLLERQTPHLSVARPSDNTILAQSLPAVDDKSRLTRGLNLCFGRAIALIERSLRLDRAEPPIDRSTLRSAPRIRLVSLTAHVAGFFAAKLAAVLRNRLGPADHWYVVLRNGDSSLVPILEDGRSSYADPFLFSAQGRTFVFVEELDQHSGKGVISAAEVVGDGLAQRPVPVLERPYHLSYPVVLKDGDDIFLLPETSANAKLELYRAVEFPWRWAFDSVLIDDMALADATPVYYQNRWWLFAAAAEHGTTDQDELFVFYSDRLRGPWRPHARNPVKSDCRSARPAGRLVVRDGRLYRPAQDCERRYGTGIVWHEIVELDPNRYTEREVARFEATGAGALKGVHTVDQSGSIQVLDVNVDGALGGRWNLAAEAMQRLTQDIDAAFSAKLPHWRERAADDCAASRHSVTSRVA